MTREELFEITKLVGIQLYEFGDATITAEDGSMVTIPQREMIALASGITSANSILTLVPPKPVEELSIGDIRNVTNAIVTTYADLLNKMGLLFKDGGAKDGGADD